MGKFGKIILIVQVQILFILALILYIRFGDMDKRIYNTNKFLRELIVDKNVKELGHINPDDIVLGDKDAPVTVVLYTKFNCEHCHLFLEETFQDFYTQEVASGKASLTFRYVVSANEAQQTLANLAYQSYKAGTFLSFIDLFTQEDYAALEYIDMENYMNILGLAELEHNPQVAHYSDEAKASGFRKTPMFIINGEKHLGNMSLKQLSQEIETLLSQCD